MTDRDPAPPVGEVTTVWRPNRTRWDAEPDYRERVRQFVSSHVYGGSVDDAEVARDDAGQLVLSTTTWFHRDGGLRPRDPATGAPQRARVTVLLDPERDPLP